MRGGDGMNASSIREARRYRQEKSRSGMSQEAADPT
jgi:hypothetical protein